MENVAELECPVCMNLMLPPTSICENGHIVCSRCRPQLYQCPTCKMKFLSAKNTVVDQILSKCKFPCKGCEMKFDLDKLKLHENDDCYFLVKSKCPFPGCSEKLSYSQITEHLSQTHEEDVKEYSFENNEKKEGKFTTLVYYHIKLDQLKSDRLYVPWFSLPKPDNGMKFVLQQKTENGNYYAVVKQLHIPSNETQFEVIMSVISGRNELKIHSKPYDFKVEEKTMWMKPNFVLHKQMAELLFARENRVIIECEIKQL